MLGCMVSFRTTNGFKVQRKGKNGQYKISNVVDEKALTKMTRSIV